MLHMFFFLAIFIRGSVSLLNNLPVSTIFDVQDSDLNFYIYSNNKHLEQYVEVSLEEIGDHVDKEAEIVFLIHGFTENHNVSYYEILKNHFLNQTDVAYNIVQVDWSKLTDNPFYPAPALQSRQVGAMLGNVVVGLIKQGFSADKFQSIGFSLGAQVSAFIGKTVFNSIGRNIKKITGLEPAGPGFSTFLLSDADRLTKTDAELVVAVHTDGGKFGDYGPCGDVDFYVNGGTAIQPGCPRIEEGGKLIDFIFCSHLRASAYYGEAVENPRTFIATQCDSYWNYSLGKCNNNSRKIDMGGDLTLEDSGKYYLETNSLPPYAKN